MSAPTSRVDRTWRWQLALALIAAAAVVVAGSYWVFDQGATAQKVEQSLSAGVGVPVTVPATIEALDTVVGVELMTVRWTRADQVVTAQLPATGDPDLDVGDTVELRVARRGDRVDTLGGAAAGARPTDAVPEDVRSRLRTAATWLPGLAVGGFLLAGVISVAGLHFAVPQRPGA